MILASLLILFSQTAHAAQSTALLHNELDDGLVLSSINLILGSFTVSPPNRVASNDNVTWSAYGAFDAIGYQVFYQSAAWDSGTCVSLSYMWDLVAADCNADFTPCPAAKQQHKQAKQNKQLGKHALEAPRVLRQKWQQQKQQKSVQLAAPRGLNATTCNGISVKYDCSGLLADPTYWLVYNC